MPRPFEDKLHTQTDMQVELQQEVGPNSAHWYWCTLIGMHEGFCTLMLFIDDSIGLVYKHVGKYSA